MQKTDPVLDKALQHICDRHLRQAISQVEATLREHPDMAALNRLQTIRSDYELMLGFMVKGYHDDQREELYNGLLRRLYVLIQDIDLARRKKEMGLYAAAERLADRRNLSLDFIRSVLEGFVADAAMLSLDNETQQTRRNILYHRHQMFMNRLFCAVWTSPQWSEGERCFYEELLLSPTIDQNDVLLLVSAVMIGAMNLFDVNKALTLLHVWQHATDESVRQRALVGWALTMPQKELSLFPELTEAVHLLSVDELFLASLLELQEQLFFCLNAEKDRQQIQEDIMPTIIKNNNLNVTRFGITEKEDDPMEDILHPDAADKRMEEVEASIRKMMEMQKAGSDIYFGGFSQMKRFSFFSQMSNWFCPFYADHPGLKGVIERIDDDRIMQTLFHTGPFCDSDKYSFALALADIINSLPPSVREMMHSEEALGPVFPQEEMQKPVYIRRMYLQDLYRFFRVFPNRNELANPFERTDDKGFYRYLPMISSLLSGEQVDNCRLNLGFFLIKQQRWSELNLLLGSISDRHPDTVHRHLLTAYAAMHDGQMPKACQSFACVLAEQPKNERALRGLARASLLCEDYLQAAKTYGKLLEYHPDNKGYALNQSICRLKLGQAAEAVEVLFRLRYEYPDDKNVRRVLAWGLLCQDKLDAAQQEYRSLLEGEPQKEDYLNAGYCYWLMGNVAKAVELFRQFTILNESPYALDVEMEKDAALLEVHGITPIEMKLMADLVYSEPDCSDFG